jgi:hypothetical protein
MGIFDSWDNEVKKAKKRSTLNINKAKGSMAEKVFEGTERMKGNDVQRIHHGGDYIVTKRDMLTGKSKGKTVHEIKTGNSPLSPLQKKTKKKMGSKYKVERSGWFICEIF